MKNTIKIKVSNEREYMEVVEMLLNKGFEQIGTRLWEDSISYVRIIKWKLRMKDSMSIDINKNSYIMK